MPTGSLASGLSPISAAIQSAGEALSSGRVLWSSLVGLRWARATAPRERRLPFHELPRTRPSLSELLAGYAPRHLGCNQGFVLPTAVPRRVTVKFRRRTQLGQAPSTAPAARHPRSSPVTISGLGAASHSWSTQSCHERTRVRPRIPLRTFRPWVPAKAWSSRTSHVRAA
jgi:hypothetical protein